MLPTLNIAGDFCLVDKFHYSSGRNMKVGDLVVASKPGQPETFILKRVIGMVSQLPKSVIVLSSHRNLEAR